MLCRGQQLLAKVKELVIPDFVLRRLSVLDGQGTDDNRLADIRWQTLDAQSGRQPVSCTERHMSCIPFHCRTCDTSHEKTGGSTLAKKLSNGTKRAAIPPLSEEMWLPCDRGEIPTRLRAESTLFLISKLIHTIWVKKKLNRLEYR